MGPPEEGVYKGCSEPYKWVLDSEENSDVVKETEGEHWSAERVIGVTGTTNGPHQCPENIIDCLIGGIICARSLPSFIRIGPSLGMAKPDAADLGDKADINQTPSGKVGGKPFFDRKTQGLDGRFY